MLSLRPYFGLTSETPHEVYTLADAALLARALVGKNGITEVVAFGELAYAGQSAVLSIAFVVPDEKFRIYSTCVGTRLVSLHRNSFDERTRARQEAFAVKYGTFASTLLQALPKRNPFSPGALNLYVLPYSWRQDLRSSACVTRLQKLLYEMNHVYFAAELENTIVLASVHSTGV